MLTARGVQNAYKFLYSLRGYSWSAHNPQWSITSGESLSPYAAQTCGPLAEKLAAYILKEFRPRWLIQQNNSELLFVVNRPVPRVFSVFVYSTIEKLHYSAVIGYDGSGLSYNLTVSLGSSQKRMRAHSLHNNVSSY